MKAAILLLILLTSTPGDFIRYSGTASDPASGAFFYTEEHEEQKLETNITYRDEQSKVIVTKKIDYSKNPIQPDFLQEDLRDGYLEGATVKGMQIEMIYRKDRKQEIERKLVTIPEPAVIDGGFNNFVKEHWNELLTGKVIRFNFAIPSQLDYYSFRLYLKEDKIISGKKVVIFKMELDQFILRALSPAVVLTYDDSSRRLMEYEGLSTINDPKGKSYRVRIRYPGIGP